MKRYTAFQPIVGVEWKDGEWDISVDWSDSCVSHHNDDPEQDDDTCSHDAMAACTFLDARCRLIEDLLAVHDQQRAARAATWSPTTADIHRADALIQLMRPFIEREEKRK